MPGIGDGGQVSLAAMRSLEDGQPGKSAVFTFATLPTGQAVGARCMISDGAATPTFSAAAAGSGTLLTPVYYDGTEWRNG